MFTHKQSPDDAARNLVKEIYELYLTGLKKMVPGQRLPTGETIESEIKRVEKHLKTLK